MSKVLANVTGVAIGGRALLIEGAPGSGKSSLALALIDRGAVLVGDDAVALEMHDGRVWALPPPRTAGLLEIRHVGHARVETAAAPVALILALAPSAPRFPLDPAMRQVLGAEIPVLPFAADDHAAALRAEKALDIHGLAIPPGIEWEEHERP